MYLYIASLILSKLLSTSLPIRVNAMIFFHCTYVMIEIISPTIAFNSLLFHSAQNSVWHTIGVE